MKETQRIERRQFLRLRSVFPVEFKLLDPATDKPVSDFFQGFTADISKGGVLLRANGLKHDIITQLEKRTAKLLLHINIHFGHRPIIATARIAWMRTVTEHDREQCMMGLSFENISPAARRRFVGYAASLYWGPRLTALAIGVLVAVFIMESASERYLAKENMRLVDKLSDVLEERSAVMDMMEKTDTEKVTLVEQLEDQKKKIENMELERNKLLEEERKLQLAAQGAGGYGDELTRLRSGKEAMASQVSALVQAKEEMQKRIDFINERAQMRLDELRQIDKVRASLEKRTEDKMYDWLMFHQNRKTSLLPSYEGDKSLEGIAFTYDQSLAALVFVLNEDDDSAERIFDFFRDKAPRLHGVFANAYEVNSGAIAEPTVRVGPNAWLGIALIQYQDKTGIRHYLDIAKRIGDWIIELQAQDTEGGIRGGPDVTWFSTEHNLDAYAFLTMLAKKTGSQEYENAADKTLNWIAKNAFSNSGRINRGKGDATIATDTFSWAIAAIGPEKLMSMGMDPHAIMRFAKDQCEVTVQYDHPNGRAIEVTGFDFAKSAHVGRGGIISTEWTAQMIVALQIMTAFSYNVEERGQAEYYSVEHNKYLTTLERLIISSPSKTGQGSSCLPYATQGNADTGHGWRTPDGNDTGSVSATAYGIFAMKGYNPLKLE